MACRDAPAPMLITRNMDLKIAAALAVSREVHTLIKNDPSKMPGHIR